ncbi:MAG: DNA-processing protein DprA [Patescibacteria group bacterium]|nr:DNA-processing protein DprA [Patescibacteria group bacterium]
MDHPIKRLAQKDYPPMLREIPDMPAELYVRGKMPPKDCEYLCVVGSRATTPYGRRMCMSIISGLAGYNVAIVSGMALGIDSQAHTSALDVGLPTIAVLPSSLDDRSIYPSTNRALAARILARGCALVSEYGTAHKAMIHDFPKRNRIGAGMSRATLIIEAGEKSGTLITARLALDYNREVLAVPHELGRETGAGVNQLIRDGATLVRNADDVLQALNLKPSDKPTQTTLPTDLSPSEMKTLHALVEPLVRDELIEHSGLSAQEANVALSSLLIRGLIVERLGKVERV